MGHGQLLTDNAVCLDLNDNAPFSAPRAPTIDHVAATHGSDVFGVTRRHGQPIKVTTVLGRELTDETRLPQRLKAVHRVKAGEAGIFHVDKDNFALAIERKFMDIEVTRGL